jgi:hypothetical protein
MSDVWIYGRTPSSMVRYRHGGYNAVVPMIIHQVTTQAKLMAEREKAPPSHDRVNNILVFAPRTNPRKGRARRMGPSRSNAQNNAAHKSVDDDSHKTDQA